jgi:hypothetical protein
MIGPALLPLGILAKYPVPKGMHTGTQQSFSAAVISAMPKSERSVQAKLGNRSALH